MYVLQEMDLPIVLRLALDDHHAPVLSAAAGALVALIGIPTSQKLVFEAMHCNPVAGESNLSLVRAVSEVQCWLFPNQPCLMYNGCFSDCITLRDV